MFYTVNESILSSKLHSKKGLAKRKLKAFAFSLFPVYYGLLKHAPIQSNYFIKIILKGYYLPRVAENAPKIFANILFEDSVNT